MSSAVGQSGYAERFDYRVDILRRRNRVIAMKDGVLLAESDRTLLVDEQNHGLVFYFPRTDVRLGLLEAMPGKSSYCPYKGEASYWRRAGGSDDPVAWSYDRPFAEVSQIAGYIAFYQDRVTVSIGIATALHNRG
ncbi:MAG TPA: DUF427 domain-containing protein [Alphaproteobacteria bacterium]|nr:DUF427 domain-containing protein [Alphaproteobacteria bacterium]